MRRKKRQAGCTALLAEQAQEDDGVFRKQHRRNWARLIKKIYETDSRFRERVGEAIPLGEMQTAESVADAFAFLCSSDSDYMTGAVLVVDGGASLVSLSTDSCSPPSRRPLRSLPNRKNLGEACLLAPNYRTLHQPPPAHSWNRSGNRTQRPSFHCNPNVTRRIPG